MLENDHKEFKDTIELFTDSVKGLDKFKDESESEEESEEIISNSVIDQIVIKKQRTTNVSRRTAIDSALDTVHVSQEQSLVKGIILKLCDFFSKYLGHYSSVLWNEIIYFNDFRRIQKAFNPSTRLAIHSAITNPGYFLETSEQFDITILHKLYLECGRLINMYDWFIAFKTMIDPNSCLSEQDAQ